MVPYLNILTELTCQYNLDLTEAAVLAAVQFYCRKAPHSWKRNAEQICRDWPFMPFRTTVSKSIDRLISLGVLTVQNARITVQNARSTEQITRENEQNARYTINNNIINNNSSSLADEAATPPQLSSLSSFIPPSENEVLAYANQKKIPEMVARKFHQYYQGNGWYLRKGQKMKVWRSVLDYWWSTEQKDQQTRAVTMIQAGGRGQIIQTDRDREIEEIVRKQREADKARRAQEEASLTDEDILANQQIGLRRKQ